MAKQSIKYQLYELGVRNGRYQSKFRHRFGPILSNQHKFQIHNVWESMFMRKSKHEKRRIIQSPWVFPMAAQHLSAILIQKYARGWICRVKLEKDQRYYHSNGHENIRTHAKDYEFALSHPFQIRKQHRSLMHSFVATANGSFSDQTGFKAFAVSRIQAWYRMIPIRWAYKLQRFAVYHIAALQIQSLWHTYVGHRQYLTLNGRDSRQNGLILSYIKAAVIIQRMWKSYTNRKIYKYYHDLISFQKCGDPVRMLRSINPSEAGLLDASMGASVRFRLGGLYFPPTIYYKIFVRKPVCDLNAFSPKDYVCDIKKYIDAKLRHSHSKISKSSNSNVYTNKFLRVGKSYYRLKQQQHEEKNWYCRLENNGWRPVTAKVMSEALEDPISCSTSTKLKSKFHYSQVVRQQDVVKLRRLKKRQWMAKLYKSGLVEEIPSGIDSLIFPEYATKDEKAAIFDANFEDDKWEEHAEDMFAWAAALDYDAYCSDWNSIGKTKDTDSKQVLSIY